MVGPLPADRALEQAAAGGAFPGGPGDLAAGVSAVRAARLARLAAARLYLCTPRRHGYEAFLDGVLAPPAPGGPTGAAVAGVDLVQLREKGLEWRDEASALGRMLAAGRRHGALVSGNDRADLAAVVGVDILHVGQDDIPPATARRLLGPDVIIGLSTHDERQLEVAIEDPDVDYFCVGPVWPTPTKEGRPGVGLRLVAAAVAAAPPFALGSKPWFAIGGIDEERLDEVLATGARRAVVVRAITGADDPAAAAARLAARLRAAA
ncbi:thiamine phosphate synthase [Frankia sp. CNm7]|uniref:Thiamine-phosphate synthase n=2 Tax=Frankia nepalensis TaxID=1836974 RepID=A0A937RQR0_9ACTN|nr:thiamine phosphate synthase [Frankia nepalensis]MBL7513756.1 thiamine phosphate synthase [Frankia nepalensis]MBL7521095.1 thiamine phosphate synthase [Frankia nepalensis]MBL7631644.1 thiamine phosphate synthase [Frankia nepalensis]